MSYFMANDTLQFLIRSCGEYSARQSYRPFSFNFLIISYPCIIVTIKFQFPVHTHF